MQTDDKQAMRDFGAAWEEHDVRLRRDLVDQGWSDAELNKLVAAGTLRRLTYGVLAVGPPPEDPVVEHAQRATGIARLHGDQIALSHHSALTAYDLPLRGYVDLAGPVQAIRLHGGSRTSSAPRIRRPRRPTPDLVPISEGGLAVPPVVAALQVAAVVRHDTAVVVLDACLNARLFRPADLDTTVHDLRGTPGAGRARVAVRASSVGAQSPKETELRLFVQSLGLECTTQFPVADDPWEQPFAYADLRVTGTRLLLEYDGEEKYASGDASPLLAEKQREARIRQLGWGLERVVARDLRTPATLARRIRAAVEAWPDLQPGDVRAS